MPSSAVMMPKRPWLASVPRQIQQMRTSVPEAKRLAVTMGSVMATSTSPLDTAAMSSVADWNVWMLQAMPAFSNRPSDSATHMGRMSSVGRVPRLISAGEEFVSAVLSVLSSAVSWVELQPVSASGSAAQRAMKPAREMFMRCVQSVVGKQAYIYMPRSTIANNASAWRPGDVLGVDLVAAPRVMPKRIPRYCISLIC